MFAITCSLKAASSRRLLTPPTLFYLDSSKLDYQPWKPNFPTIFGFLRLSPRTQVQYHEIGGGKWCKGGRRMGAARKEGMGQERLLAEWDFSREIECSLIENNYIR
jgi:hypothetical protein